MKPSLLLISIDGLNPGILNEFKKRGLALTNLDTYANQGFLAKSGMQSVFPTFTYPCHQSMITGVSPLKHGVCNNTLFDPMATHKGAWNWFASQNVDNLWRLASANGYDSASVAFPSSVGGGADYLIPEFWWDGSEIDIQFIDAMSTPQGIVREMEREHIKCPSGIDLTIDGDRNRFEAARWMLKNKLCPKKSGKPYFFSCYFGSYDQMTHYNGVLSDLSIAALVNIDSYIGELIDIARKQTDGELIVCIVSDHGLLTNEYCINPNVLLVENGLIQLDQNGKISSWRAWTQRAGGTAEIRLRDQSDIEAKRILERVISTLMQQPENGIEEVLSREEACQRGAFPDASYVLVSKRGYEIRENTSGLYLTKNTVLKAQHGYSEKFPEMNATFILFGQGITKEMIPDRLSLIDVAPTLAVLMGFEMPDADGCNVLR